MNAMAKTLRRAISPTIVFVALTPWPADCNMNNVEDAEDIAARTSADCNSNGIPDECDLTAFRIGYAEPREFPTSLDSPESPSGALRGDFDGDDDIDVVVLQGSGSDQTDSVTAGDGTFEPPEPVTSWLSLSAIVAADLEGDEDLDLVVAFHRPEQNVRTFINQGDGTFEIGRSFLQGRQVGNWRPLISMTMATSISPQPMRRT